MKIEREKRVSIWINSCFSLMEDSSPSRNRIFLRSKNEKQTGAVTTASACFFSIIFLSSEKEISKTMKDNLFRVTKRCFHRNDLYSNERECFFFFRGEILRVPRGKGTF